MNDKNVKPPIIEEIEYGSGQLDKLETSLDDKNRELLYTYPTVYLVYHENKDDQSYDVYVGETNDIKRRTEQHIKDDPKSYEKWEQLVSQDDVNMFMIGHEHFNKSLTLDIENQFMLYLHANKIVNVLNGRTNDQGNYFPADELKIIFSKIWRKLGKVNNQLFPALHVLRTMAIFKASPFHKLTREQLKAKDSIIERISETLVNSNPDDNGKLIIVRGEAGAGKTVLLSNLFYQLTTNEEVNDQKLDVHLLVNHKQQVELYKNIANKVEGLDEKKVWGPTPFINAKLKETQKVDVALVDEGHLLLTKGNQGYHTENKNHIKDLLECAKVVVLVYDPNQALQSDQIIEDSQWQEMLSMLNDKRDLIELKNQMRIDASKETVKWIRSLVDEQIISKIPKDDKYEIRIFDKPLDLQKAINAKNKSDEKDNFDNGISRIVAIYDWDYNGAKRPTETDTWDVKIGDWRMPWNYELEQIDKKSTKHRSVEYKYETWAENRKTINEVGSTYSIQGFDLNYVGVIIGPSVKYRDGKVIFDKTASKNKKAIQNRTMADGTKHNYADRLLKNELNVLLTRGVHGLYIYAVDEELRNALKKASKN